MVSESTMVVESMTEMGAKKSRQDNAVYYWTENDELVGLSASHVDDFITTGSEEFLNHVTKGIRDRFRVSAESEGSFKYIGLQISQNNQCITVSQSDYLEDIQPIVGIESSEIPLDPEELRALKSIAGSLNWISSHSRPDVSYDVCEVNKSIKDATHKDLFTANKGIRKAKSQNTKLEFPNLGNIEEARIVGYADASFKNLKGGASQGGYLIFLQGGNIRC